MEILALLWDGLSPILSWIWRNHFPFTMIFLAWSIWRDNGYHFTRWPKLPPAYKFKLVYSDEKPDKPVEGATYCTILKSEKYDISGKPDFIYSDRRRRNFFPTELKSHTLGIDKKESDHKLQHTKPRDKDLHQLYMYFLIVGETYGHVPYGWLIYSDGMFKVYNTCQARKKITRLLGDMRHMLDTGHGQPNPSFINCKHCVCRETVCEHND